jgi:MYXO-CTERM domain-containing protein
MRNSLTKIFSAGFIALSIGILPLSLSARAQTTSSPGNATTTTTDTRTYNRGFDWGWLGLLGLFGLAGLAGRKRSEKPTRYRDPNAVSSTSYRE